jgi:hypothetical protein
MHCSRRFTVLLSDWAPAAALLLGFSLLLGCGRSDTAPPVTEQEVEELQLEFDAGMEAPLDEPADTNDSTDGTP